MVEARMFSGPLVVTGVIAVRFWRAARLLGPDGVDQRDLPDADGSCFDRATSDRINVVMIKIDRV
ncbi:hypothetical protein M2163_000484 [Streptomyces sp. SAI-135]|jgi:hypothetical protein|uniref:hypothetical protein n=1 Tax=unclassified Streptomyces TaxID=2593676 RepID=UPI002477134C|nr:MULTISPECIES: hypothetical protein [unclassified Streptomyces]MDH6523011.1 hypothetical protein [Streptomyces sp. SAI-090]MDH6554628.1 hypothetical protein [Streptomyces sp. SAI-041]MDH6573894.1 hypothetical protein [Streptomyces sp. SAI-117]MDH6581370.1 hypothetical protein [Streptomyces sp. SAI-133]MDH6613376.1 hypothetical protein [Streptomyces sp. SAI-135]